MTTRVGPKGQVVIPKELRDAFGFEPGTEVVAWIEGDHVALRPVTRGRPLRGRYQGSPLVSELERGRREDRERSR